MQFRSFLLILLVMTTTMPTDAQQQAGRYAAVNGLQLYYEIHGSGTPLVLLHGGGSTIESSFGRILPVLAQNHKVIAIELQAHGHTVDIDRPLSFEQDADDVAALLQQLHIGKADIMGFSNGGTTALQMAIRHPGQVRKLVLISTLYKRSGVQPGFFEAMQQATIEQMPQPLKDAYIKVNPDPKGLQAMFDRDATRMRNFKDISDEAVKAVQAQALVINNDAEVILAAHALELAHTLPHASLAILPGNHGDCIGEVCTANPNSTIPGLVVAMIDDFLKK